MLNITVALSSKTRYGPVLNTIWCSTSSNTRHGHVLNSPLLAVVLLVEKLDHAMLLPAGALGVLSLNKSVYTTWEKNNKQTNNNKWEEAKLKETKCYSVLLLLLLLSEHEIVNWHIVKQETSATSTKYHSLSMACTTHCTDARLRCT